MNNNTFTEVSEISMTLTTFTEASERSIALLDDISVIKALTGSGNMKFLTRVEREVFLKRIIENMGALEDIIKVIVKDARAVRRARVRNDDQMSRMVIAMTSNGLRVDSFELPEADGSPEIKNVYAQIPNIA